MNSWDNGPGNNNYGHDGWHFCDQNNNNIGPVSRGQILELLDKANYTKVATYGNKASAIVGRQSANLKSSGNNCEMRIFV